MSRWDCDHPGCSSTACGAGGAIGLVAIGWTFERGGPGREPRCFCPAHGPEKWPCTNPPEGEAPGKPCSQCAAERKAARLQAWLEAMVDSRLFFQPCDTCVVPTSCTYHGSCSGFRARNDALELEPTGR